MITPEYREKVMQWRSERDNGIRQENSWLALAGLFWLKEGENRLGSDPASEILLPQRAPASLGSFHFDGKQVTLRVNAGQSVLVNGKQVDQILLKSDHEDAPSFITLDNIRMVVIDRPNGIGIRLWDNLSPERRNHPPREWFPINEAMRVPARYTRYPEPKPVLLPDTFGEIQEGSMDGQVTFEIDHKVFSLDVTEEPDHRLYIQFRDLTSGRDTYASGRYYYTEDPVVDGKVMLDFNFAYSPPCAFTGFATCVFAPSQNNLNIRVEAGEIYSH